MKIVKFKGNPLKLVGRKIKVGDYAPDFRIVSNELKEFTLKDFKDRIKLITTFPSLDTPVCDLQLKEFNKKAQDFSADIIILGISKDLPFAQYRFCQVNTIDRLKVFSDYKYSFFGINYGLLIKELSLLARAVLIIDKADIIRYIQIAEELTQQLNYEDVLINLGQIVKTKHAPTSLKPQIKCKPCEGKILPLDIKDIEKLYSDCSSWQLVDGKKLVKEFKFEDFLDAKYFLDLVSIVAQEQNHHPNFTLIYNKLRITLTTHAAGGLTENDFIMAKIIDELYDF